MANIVYKETVKFNDKLMLALLLVAMGATIAGLLKVLLTNSSNIGALVIYALLITGFFLIIKWIMNLRLKIKISNKGLKFKMSPFHHSSRKIKWEEVDSCQVIETPRIAQWHGSNIRFGGTSWFSLSGRNGLFITTHDGQQYFIGCENLEELREGLAQIDLVDCPEKK